METVKKALNKYKDLLILSILAVMIGAVVGAIDTLFGKGLLAITDIRNHYVYQFVPFLPLAGLLIVLLYSKIGKNSIKGMALLFSVRFQEEDSIPKRMVPLAILSTWITHLFGGSAGREGVAVQIGGTVAHSVGKRLRIQNASKILLITGMAAGFAGLFHTPIAATFFAMELFIAGSVEYSAFIPSVIAAYLASYTSYAFGLEEFGIKLNCSFHMNALFILKMVLLGILFGVVGGMFAYILNWSRSFFSKHIPNVFFRILIMGCILSVFIMILHKGRYAGSGSNLIQAALTDERIYGYDWLFKFLLTILTMSAGFQGGEVTPLFSIGASLGAVLAPMLGLPKEFIAALGYVAVFGSGTNTILAPILIGGEIFGYEYLPYFFIVSVIAYTFNGNKSIYPSQKILEKLKLDLKKQKE